MTFTVLAIVSITQLLFAALLAAFLFAHRARVERRLSEESRGLAAVAVPLRAWLVGEGGVHDVRDALDALPPDAARATALRIGRDQLTREASGELAHAVRDRAWVRDGFAHATSPWWWRRLEAARLLADLGTLDVEPLVRRLLRDKHPAVRIAATSCLSRIPTSAVVNVVLDELPRQPLAVRAMQIGMLREQWQLTREALLPRLEPNAPIDALPYWVNAAEALETADVLAKLVPLQAHASAQVRIAVARALKKYFHPDATRVLATLLHDVDWRVRAQAARSLGVLRDTTAVPALVSGLTDVAWWVRFRSALALSQLGEQGRAALRAATGSNDKFAANMASMVRGLSDGSVVELVEG